MSKYYHDSQIQDLMNKEINIVIKPYRKILNKYKYASKLFNAKYKNHYGIGVFIDFKFLNIYLVNLQNNNEIKGTLAKVPSELLHSVPHFI